MALKTTLPAAIFCVCLCKSTGDLMIAMTLLIGPSMLLNGAVLSPKFSSY